MAVDPQLMMSERIRFVMADFSNLEFDVSYETAIEF
jgi:hypothetical protein